MQFPKILIMTLFIAGIGFFCGCSANNKTGRPIEYYTLHYEPPASDEAPPLPVTLSIEKFTTSPPYNTTRIIYSTSEFSQNRYYYHQWITPPDEIVTQLLARDLITSNRFLAVMISNNMFADFLLTGTIDEFYEQDLDSQWNAVLSITIVLMNNLGKDETERICFQKNYKKIHLCEQKNPKSLARALSMDMSEISGQIREDIISAIVKLNGSQETPGKL